ncbi:MAG: lipid IV(A) 3-deoxy-D-manno-octulosonic acid transferase [Campylobacter sp.]|nr:lipid IV(A) 3-deoxy-D-manno-octulosonic acid transferase [Campylobacter sp.]
MLAIYYILALIAWTFGAIFLLILAFKQKYRFSIPARFFLYKNLSYKQAKVHFHACSFGEIRAIKPILTEFDSKFISVITKTGFDEAKKICQNVAFLPFEIFLPFWLKSSKVLVIFEAELWLMLVFIAKLKGSRILLINARISDRSYKRYLKFAFFYKKIFSYINAVYAQSEQDKLRLEKLGAKNIQICGNIKSAFLPKTTKNYQKPSQKVIVLASTHSGEEKILLDEIKLRDDEKLIIAPRHPERFGEVELLAKEYAKKFSLSFSKFSVSKNFDSQICLIDCLGELVNIYAISDIVVLGGSFVPNVGGHNPIEAAQFKNAIISGEDIFNQKSLFSAVDNIKFAKANEIDALIHSDLKISKIAQIGDASMILQDIRTHCGTR